MAAFNGVTCFGVGAYSRARPNPARAQWNAFNGLHGRQRLALGGNGYTVEFEFLQTASDLATLAAYEQVFCDWLRIGTTANLVDTLGSTWPGAVLVAFEPAEAITIESVGVVSRTYRALFEVL
ncbi:MAG: hypothetical protein M3P94_07230 [Chloroflexota bacterium]|nr:hypothetical protein [Chloroflexota bacterium]